MKYYKHGEMGIGTLILFIALLLSAIVVATVLIQTSGSLQEKSLSTGEQTKKQMTTFLSIIDIIGEDGRNHFLDLFTINAKLASGSDSIRLEQTILIVNTPYAIAHLKYAGINSSYENNPLGYYTLKENQNETILGGPLSWEIPIIDYDYDQMQETILGGNNSNNASLILSSGESINLGNCQNELFNSVLVSNDYINSVEGNCGVGSEENNTINITLFRSNINQGNGFFTVEHIFKSNNYVEGNINKGDIIKIYFEAPISVGENERFIINFIPRGGTNTKIEMNTPEVISYEKMTIFP
jgi:archaellin